MSTAAATAGVARRAGSRVGVSLGRAIVVVMVVTYFSLLAGLGGREQWNRLGVGVVTPSFMDMRTVTSGWECTRKGYDVLPKNPCNPYGNPANYPRIWMALAPLGLGQESTVTLGIIAGLVFLMTAILVLPREAGAGEAAIYGLAVCSPAVMLGVERGNVDIILFALVAAGVLLLRRGDRGVSSGSALILFAAILKLFPIFAAITFLRQPVRKAVLFGGAVFGLFGLYALATLDDIRTISNVTPQVGIASFGIRRFTDWLVGKPTLPWLSNFVSEKVGPFAFDLGVVGLVVAGVVALRLAAPRIFPRDTGDPSAQTILDLFYAGAGIYVLSYVFFRSFDYRLVFVLLTIPQLVRWARNRNPVGILGLVAAFGVLFLDAQRYWQHALLARQSFLAWESVASLGGAISDPLEAVVAAQILLFLCFLAAFVGTLEGVLRRLGRPVPL